MEHVAAIEKLLLMHRDELDLLRNKGVEYSRGSPDAQANFRETANFLHISPELALSVGLYKQLSAIFYAVGDKTETVAPTETIESRILDARLYLFHLSCLLKERSEDADKKETGV